MAQSRPKSRAIAMQGDAEHPQPDVTVPGKGKGGFPPEVANPTPISGNSVPSPARSSHPEKNEREIYWTIHRRGFEAAASWKVTAKQLPPHYLCDFQCATAKKLMKELRTKSWKASDFNNSDKQALARVEISANGFNVLFFSSYAAAVADDEARAAMTRANNLR